MDDYYDDDDFINFPSDEWKEIAGDDADIISQVYPVPEGPFIILEKKYGDFNTCFKESKDKIYRKMLDIYEKTKDTESNNSNLCVIATIDDCAFSTNFSINKRSSEQIISVIIPYMEEIEDYETCDRALKLYNQINR